MNEIHVKRNPDKDIIIKLSIYKYEFHNEARVS